MVEAERRNLEKSRLLASFAHDIRSPLISLIGSLELIREEHENVHSARSSAEALLQLVDDILELSVLGSDALTIHPSPVDLRQIAAALSDQTRPLAARKGLALRLDLDPNLSVSVEVDRLRLQQVLSNLLTNAVKYTDQGSVTLRIRQEGEQGGRVTLDLAVIDTGIGAVHQTDRTPAASCASFGGDPASSRGRACIARRTHGVEMCGLGPQPIVTSGSLTSGVVGRS